MPIPHLVGGLLPMGVHDCSLNELAVAFGQFDRSDRRPMLMAKLRLYFAELAATDLAQYVIVDGSFVTAKPEPNDVDLILVLRPHVDTDTYEFRPFELNVASAKRVLTRFAFDLKVARSESGEYASALAVFHRVKGQPSQQKGLLRVPT